MGKYNHIVASPVLIGLMGCGKSSIGRRLAKKLHIPLIDLDDYIVKQAGMSIPDIFAGKGEDTFRDMESQALKEVLDASRSKRAVIATGGGIVMREENRRLLHDHPPVIWLKAAPKFLAGRIDGDANRPLIASVDTLAKLKELAEIRYPLYEQCSHLILQRDELKKRKVLKKILKYLAKRGKSSSPFSV